MLHFKSFNRCLFIAILFLNSWTERSFVNDTDSFMILMSSLITKGNSSKLSSKNYYLYCILQERRSTSVNDEEPSKEEIAAWALEDDNANSTTPTKTSGSNIEQRLNSTASRSHQQNVSYFTKDDQPDVRVLPIRMEQDGSSSKEKSKQFASARSMFENAQDPDIRNIPVRLSAPPVKIGVVHEQSQPSAEPTRIDIVESRSVKKLYSDNRWDKIEPDAGAPAAKATDRKEEIQRLPVTRVEQPKKVCKSLFVG